MAEQNQAAKGLPRKDQSNPTESGVLYTIACRDAVSEDVRKYASATNPFSSMKLELEHLMPASPIEVVIEASGTWSMRRDVVPQFVPPRRFEYRNATTVEGSDIPMHQNIEFINGAIPSCDLGSFTPSSVVIKEIRVRSTRLVDFLRSFIQHYPEQPLLGERMTIQAPFKLLAHYYQALTEIKDAGTPNSHAVVSPSPGEIQAPVSATIDTELDPTTKYELGSLLDSFESEYLRVFAEEQVKYASGVASFELLWYLFKPGEKVYARVDGKLVGMIFESSKRILGRGDDEIVYRVAPRRRHTADGKVGDQRKGYWECRCWSFDFDGKMIGQENHEVHIDLFPGDKEITSLPVFPVHYVDSSDGGKTRAELEKRGEKFFSIARASSGHMGYSGTGWSLDSDEGYYRPESSPDTQYSGEIMIDYNPQVSSRKSRRRSRSYSPVRRYGAGEVHVTTVETHEDGDGEHNNHEPPELATRQLVPVFGKINPRNYTHLTSDHYFLLPYYMIGFALKHKQRMIFAVDGICPIEWPSTHNDPMSTLILKESDKDLIKALAQQHSKDYRQWSADHVGGKGEGQIFLLHGPPGTGKTYTVECVARYTHRPLLRLTVADIGTDEVSMEEILGEWFQKATKWGAIILIDEADVFLEKRQVKDLQRNSLVSVFLSCMEYYSGMLFLTTNRIGQIDDAFLSRITVALTYETLDAGKQKLLWQGFLKKLSDERKDIRLTDRAKKFLENIDKDETTKDLLWNGREIRNGLQSAIALATFDARKEAEAEGVKPSLILVRDEHFQAIVDRRREFVSYRKSIRNQDEDARAYTEGNRGPPPRRS